MLVGWFNSLINRTRTRSPCRIRISGPGVCPSNNQVSDIVELSGTRAVGVICARSSRNPSAARVGTNIGNPAKAPKAVLFATKFRRVIIDQVTSNQVVIPAAACSSIWQWNSHLPGLSATKAMPTVSLRSIMNVSRQCFSSNSLPFNETT